MRRGAGECALPGRLLILALLPGAYCVHHIATAPLRFARLGKPQLDNGANADAREGQPLRAACTGKHVETARLLVRHAETRAL